MPKEDLVVSKTFRSKAAYWCGTSIFILYILSAVLLGVVAGVNHGGDIQGFAGFALSLFFGIMMWPAFAFEGDILAKVICVLFLVLIVLEVYLTKTKNILTKAEKIKHLENELREKNLEYRFPEVIALKKQIEEAKDQQSKMEKEIKRMKATIAQTSKEDLCFAFHGGKITADQYQKLINDYDLCKSFIAHAPDMKLATEKMIKDLEQQIESYRKKNEIFL